MSTLQSANVFDVSSARLRHGAVLALVVGLVAFAAGCELDKLVASPPGANSDTGGIPGGPRGNARPFAITIVGGDAQTDTVAATLQVPYTIEVVDADGFGVAGVAVDWSVLAGAGSIDAQSVTDAAGHASARRVLGSVAGSQSATASVAALANASVRFSAVATAGAPAQLVFAQQPANARSKSTISPAVVVHVRDRFGNRTSRAAHSVAISLVPGTGTPGAKLSGDRTETASGGVASFNDLKISLPGFSFRLRASSGDLQTDSESFLVY